MSVAREAGDGMTQRSFLLTTILLCGCLFISCTKNDEGVRKETVVDNVGVLSKAENAELSRFAETIQEKYQVDLMIVIGDSLEGRSILDYSRLVYERSRLMKLKSHRWILIVIMMKNRAIRINIGTGLSNEVSSADCDLVIKEFIVPLFRKEQYVDGLTKAISHLMGCMHPHARSGSYE